MRTEERMKRAMDDDARKVQMVRRARLMREVAVEAAAVGGMADWLEECLDDPARVLVIRDASGALAGIRIVAEDAPVTYLDTMSGAAVCEDLGTVRAEVPRGVCDALVEAARGRVI